MHDLSRLNKWPRVACLASYPPRECGIATFTRDLAQGSPGEWAFMAVDEPGGAIDYGTEVRLRIRRDQPEDYRAAAEWVNRSSIDVVNLQHEYGLFGGPRGQYLQHFLRHVRRPVVTTLHTVLPSPDEMTHRATRRILESSQAVVVQTQLALDLLHRFYGPVETLTEVIPHGVPDVPYRPGSREAMKASLGVAGRTVLATFGLINPGKGVEYALHALPDVVRERSDVVYLVIGETHPGVRAQSGESYRQGLEALTHSLGLDGHVQFINRYLSLAEVIRYLIATDVYLMPYLEPSQIVSGTLAYALGAGRAVVATPFAYAREVLAAGRGWLVPFRDSKAISQAVGSLLDDVVLRATMEARAYDYTRDWIWPQVRRRYHLLTQRVLGRSPHALAPEKASRPVQPVMPA